MSGKRERPDREGQRNLSAFVDPSVHRAFKMLAVKESTTTVALMHEAIAHVLVHHGEPLPQKAIDHLVEHGRPLPSAVRSPKGNDLG